MSDAMPRRRLSFRRENLEHASVYVVGFTDERTTHWSPSPKTRESIGVLHRLAGSRGVHIDVSTLHPNAPGDANLTRRQLKWAAGTLSDVCEPLAQVLRQVRVLSDGDRLLACLPSRTNGIDLDAW
ncbi:MAG: hypothetical protein V4569_04465 [Pseudomonadota bacterium]